MILSHAFSWLANRGVMPDHKAKKCAKVISHAEHAGGGVVGIEFMSNHYFSASTLMAFAFVFFVLQFLLNED